MKNKPVGWTAFMEECLTQLEKAEEAPLDAKLVTLAKLAKLLDDIQNIGTWKPMQAFPVEEHSPHPSLYMKAFLRELAEIKSTSMPDVLSSSKCTPVYLCSAYKNGYKC